MQLEKSKGAKPGFMASSDYDGAATSYALAQIGPSPPSISDAIAFHHPYLHPPPRFQHYGKLAKQGFHEEFA